MHARLPHDVPRREPRTAAAARRVASVLPRAPHRRGAGGSRRGRRGRRGLGPGGAPDRQGRLARHRMAARVRRAGPAGDGPVHLLRRDPARRCAVPLRHHQHRRADHHALRHRRAEVVLPAADPRRRAQFRHRLHRARGRHRPGLVAHAGGARRRGVRRQRREDLHQWRRPGRLRVAGRTDRPGRSQAQGHLDPVCAHDLGRLRVVDHPHRRRADDDADLLRQRARAGGQPGRGRERGLAHDHHSAQPRACRPGRVERSGHLALRGHRGVGSGAADRRRQDADRPGLGADGSRQVPRRAPGHVAAQLAHGGARGRWGADRRRVVVDQGVRDRAHRRGDAAVAGRGGRRRLPGAGLAGCAAARPARGHGAPGADQHVRGRGERGATRDRGHGRTGDDAGAR